MSEGEDEGYLACIEDIEKCKLDIVEGEESLCAQIQGGYQSRNGGKFPKQIQRCFQHHHQRNRTP